MINSMLLSYENYIIESCTLLLLTSTIVELLHNYNRVKTYESNEDPIISRKWDRKSIRNKVNKTEKLK